ncbi:MAG: MOSC domain-containing protein [Ignavibacteriae bacterium]|nr:MOSC domain-containing protein [Ignavibacteriota bacterium]
MKLSEIFIYPIKSLGGISLQSANIEKRGLQYDRRWMLIDKNNKFITQRTFPQMSLLNVELSKEGLEVSHKIKSIKNLLVPFESCGSEINVTVWNDNCLGQTISKKIDDWFSEALEINCKLVYMPETTERKVDPRYVLDKKLVGFADGYPFLIIGQSSLDFLNSKLKIPVQMNRFRPNFVFIGGKPHAEDNWNQFRISSAIFNAVKPCSRCVLTTVNQETGIKGKEPLATLSKYRKVNNKVLFGQNLVCTKTNRISTGDIIKILD